MTVRTLPLVLAVVVAAGCGGGSPATKSPPRPRETVGRFVQRIDGYLADGRYSLAWRELHPGQQRFISERLFVACYRLAGLRLPLREIRILDVHEDLLDIPGVAQEVPATSVTVRLDLGPGLGAITHRQHAVLVEGRWRWAVAAASRKAFVKRSCPDLPPPTGEQPG